MHTLVSNKILITTFFNIPIVKDWEYFPFDLFKIIRTTCYLYAMNSFQAFSSLRRISFHCFQPGKQKWDSPFEDKLHEKSYLRIVSFRFDQACKRNRVNKRFFFFLLWNLILKIIRRRRGGGNGSSQWSAVDDHDLGSWPEIPFSIDDRF